MKIYHHYNNDYNTDSCEIIAPYIMDLLNPKSIVDIGCALGQWLYVFKKLGVKKVLGIDGPHVPCERRYIKEEFFEYDLNNCETFKYNQKFDLALCLEVAEHLIDNKAEKFVDMICSLSDCIVFSAAIPGQTGENHFNEQYPDYWIKLFNKKGYKVLDPFRKKFWNTEVHWWYSQNMYLFVKGEIPNNLKEFIWDGNIYIHPRLFEMYVKKDNSQKRGLKNKIKKLLKFFFTTRAGQKE